MKALKNGKAAGTDMIIGEFLKYGGKAAVTTLHRIYSKVLEEGEVPLDWKKSRITLVHKGDGKDRQDIANYRPIAVINILAKIFGMIINEKIRTWIETHKILGEEQSGFRKGRGGLENILTLKEIIDRNRQRKKKLLNFHRYRKGIRLSKQTKPSEMIETHRSRWNNSKNYRRSIYRKQSSIHSGKHHHRMDGK